MEYQELKKALIDDNSYNSRQLLSVLSELLSLDLITYYHPYDLVRNEFGICGFQVYFHYSLNSCDFRAFLSLKMYFNLKSVDNGTLCLYIGV